MKTKVKNMSDDTLAAHVSEHPKMAGVLFTILLLKSRTGTAATQSTAYAGP